MRKCIPTRDARMSALHSRWLRDGCASAMRTRNFGSTTRLTSKSAAISCWEPVAASSNNKKSQNAARVCVWRYPRAWRRQTLAQTYKSRPSSLEITDYISHRAWEALNREGFGVPRAMAAGSSTTGSASSRPGGALAKVNGLELIVFDLGKGRATGRDGEMCQPRQSRASRTQNETKCQQELSPSFGALFSKTIHELCVCSSAMSLPVSRLAPCLRNETHICLATCASPDVKSCCCKSQQLHAGQLFLFSIARLELLRTAIPGAHFLFATKSLVRRASISSGQLFFESRFHSRLAASVSHFSFFLFVFRSVAQRAASRLHLF